MHNTLINMDHFSKVPEHLIREVVLPFAYNSQSKELCEDIRSFYHTKNDVINIYKNKFERLYGYGNGYGYGNDIQGYAQNSRFDNLCIEWLDNDIIYYLNENVPIVDKLTDTCIVRFQRMYKLYDQPVSYIKSYIWNKFKNSKFYIKRNICTNLGMMNIDERENFLRLMIM